MNLERYECNVLKAHGLDDCVLIVRLVVFVCFTCDEENKS
jgi:hypothetical protein